MQPSGKCKKRKHTNKDQRIITVQHEALQKLKMKTQKSKRVKIEKVKLLNEFWQKS